MTQAEQLLRYVRKNGFIRPRDLAPLRIPRSVLKRLTDSGRLTRRGRGVYAVRGHKPTEHTDLAAVSTRSPKSVICLLSALQFHDLTTQNPFEVWIMINTKAHPPGIEHPPVRVIRASGAALRDGVERHRIEGVTINVTSPAKTVADCFRYRRTVGVDVAIEALRDCLSRRKATIDDIYRFAKVDRVAKVVRPYLESLS